MMNQRQRCGECPRPSSELPPLFLDCMSQCCGDRTSFLHGNRGRVSDPIDEQHTLEVIELVLDHASLKIDVLVDASLAGMVQVREHDFCRTVDRSINARNAETPLLIGR